LPFQDGDFVRSYPTLRLVQPIEESLLRGNPWIFEDALPPISGSPGDLVDIETARGEWLGRGVLDPTSPLRVRLWTLNREVDVDDSLLQTRIRAALKRRPFPSTETTGFRLLHGEGDRVPGLVCDVYGSVAVLRPDGLASERWLKPARRFVGQLLDIEHWAIRRSRQHRGGNLEATWWGDEPEGPVRFVEESMIFEVDPLRGQKTGFFLDQRANRRRVAALSTGKRVLNLFGYTGGFSVAAALAGAARTTTVDLASPAIEAARRHFELNGLPAVAHEFVTADVFEYLADFSPRSAPFEVVICDPPSFAHRRSDVPAATAKYTELFARVLEIMPESSTVVLASCSSHIDRSRFMELLATASHRAQTPLILSGCYGADVDHPVPAGFPEADYLQCAIGTLAGD
jgi:23S rRNA (cytosine1962-C5)-methyltransferase